MGGRRRRRRMTLMPRGEREAGRQTTPMSGILRIGADRRHKRDERRRRRRRKKGAEIQ